jgi:hypothetical protein
VPSLDVVVVRTGDDRDDDVDEDRLLALALAAAQQALEASTQTYVPVSWK